MGRIVAAPFGRHVSPFIYGIKNGGAQRAPLQLTRVRQFYPSGFAGLSKLKAHSSKLNHSFGATSTAQGRERVPVMAAVPLTLSPFKYMAEEVPPSRFRAFTAPYFTIMSISSW